MEVAEVVRALRRIPRLLRALYLASSESDARPGIVVSVATAGDLEPPLKFLAKLGTDFWGLRVGIRTVDLWDFDQIGYVLEFGAGSW